jgi:isoquinoline 1-oxidoreductase subunit beta
VRNPTLDRRRFVIVSASTGAALVLGVRTLDAWVNDGKSARKGAIDGGLEPSMYLAIDAAGTVTIRSHKSEMGQGVWTSLPMIVAEELDADWNKVRVERAATNGKFATSTGGSSSVRGSFTQLRTAGATARAMLVAAAAEAWGVPAAECTTAAGVVTHAASKRTASYGDLVPAAAKLPVPAAADIKLKDPAQFRLVGKTMPRLDVPSKTDGTAQFGIDVRVPNMLVASVARAPEIGGSLKSVNDTRARAIAGVQRIIPLEAVEHLLPARVAVLATDTWSAMSGRRALQIEWTSGPNAKYSSAEASTAYHAQIAGDAAVTGSGGTVREPAAGEKLVEAVYEFPLLAHAPMEPMNCTADVRADGVDIWAPTQAPDGLRTAVARFLGVPVESVNVHPTFLGGGFGRRSKEDFGVEAAQISKAAGRPVKVIWSREEDIQHDFYRVDGLQRMRAVVDGQGTIASWEDRVVGPSTEAYATPTSTRHADQPARPPYNITNFKLDMVFVPSPVPMHWWRAVSNT